MLVLARAYGGEPLPRNLIERARDVIYLSNPSVENAIGRKAIGGVGFPKDDVFEYDSQLLGLLVDAYKNKDIVRLEGLWRKAKPLSSNV